MHAFTSTIDAKHFNGTLFHHNNTLIQIETLQRTNGIFCFSTLITFKLLQLKLETLNAHHKYKIINKKKIGT